MAALMQSANYHDPRSTPTCKMEPNIDAYGKYAEAAGAILDRVRCEDCKASP
jgi:hypothetical protein